MFCYTVFFYFEGADLHVLHTNSLCGASAKAAEATRRSYVIMRGKHPFSVQSFYLLIKGD